MPTYLGRPIRRREDAALLTGRGHFVDDLSLPGMVYLQFARSPHAHARILRLDIAPALQLDGVMTVLRPRTSPICQTCRSISARAA